MSLAKFDLDSLSVIDGGLIKAAFEQDLARLRADCEDRPALDKPRKLTLTFTLVPVCKPNGELDSVATTVEVTHAMPKRVSPEYSMKPGRGGLYYNELSRENVNQRTLDDAPRPRAAEEVS